MSNLPTAKDPQTWADLKFHATQVKFLQHYIETNQHPSSLVVSGHTGVGKTSAVRLYIRSTLCRQRSPGSVEPCNQCAVCQLDPRTMGAANNVIWVQSGKEDSLTVQINAALEEAAQPPNGTDEEHRYWKFIVIDELQRVPKDRLQDLLFYTEMPYVHTVNRVIFVFITMDEARIEPTVMKALTDRSAYLPFRALSEDELLQYLQANYPTLHPESASMLAHYAEGSLRSTLAAIERCQVIDPQLGPTSVAEVLFYASASVRQRLWQLLAARNYPELQKFWTENQSAFDPKRLVQQLLRDLDQAMLTRPTADQLRAQQIIFSWLTASAQIRPLDLLKMLVGMDLVTVVAPQSHDQNGYDRVFGGQL